MRKYLQILFFTACLFLTADPLCFAQNDTLWNKWINYNQKYYKIPITQNGIYRIDSLTLAQAGITPVDPRNFQLFFRGQEQHIYIKGEADGVLNSSDYIEFYGKKNDGSLDSTLYKGDLYNKPVNQPNPYYSLFNDTSAYFLTWNTSTPHKRIIDSVITCPTCTPTNYFMREEIAESHSGYYYGRSDLANINFPEYHQVEGWAGDRFNIGEHHTATFNTTNLVSNGLYNVEIKLAVMGASDDVNKSLFDHSISIKYKNNFGTYSTLQDTMFNGYHLFAHSYSVTANSFGQAPTDIVMYALGPVPPVYFSTSSNAVPYIVMKYPHSMKLENTSYYEMLVPDDSSQPKSSFSFTDFDDLGSVAHMYDFENHLRIPVTKNGTVYNVFVPNAISGNEKFCIIKSDSQFLTVQAIRPVQGTGTFTDYSLGAPDSAFIIITHKSLMAGANDYKTYRSSPAGGSRNVMIVDIDDLYDQFAYGIQKHPFAIRHFAKYCVDKFSTRPHDLFLLGKSIQTNLARNQTAYSDPTGKNYAHSLVPSLGYPTCDNMLVDAMNGNLLAPIIPTGRLSAKNNQDIALYLNKVKEYEDPHPNPEEWMKKMIFIAGGTNKQQGDQFANFLKGYAITMMGPFFGGDTSIFRKNSSLPTHTSFPDSIKGLINNGVSIINFFGHTSSSVFEFNLLPPDQYDNTNGKYPLFIADGCISGDVHQPFESGGSSSEIYTLSNKGTIAFLGSSGPGTPGELDNLTSHIYKGIGQNLYGKSIGRCLQAAIDSIDWNANNDIYTTASCLEMTLEGDPSIVIHSNKFPDYEVHTASVYFKPAYVSTDMGAFDMKVVVTNIGKAVNDSVNVHIKRIFLDGTSASYSKKVKHIYYKDTVSFTLPVDPIHGPGLNKFEVMVDSGNVITEMSELNNDLNGIQLLIYSGDILPVYPYKYAIVPKDSITLKAYTANPFAPSTKYIFEIDTSDSFSNPLSTQYVTQKGAVVKAPFSQWQTPFTFTDSTVYYWRVRRDDPSDTTIRWRESSFQYRPGIRGWGQSHIFQFMKGNTYNGLFTNRPGRSIDFDYHNSGITVQSLNAPNAQTYFELEGLHYYLQSYIGNTVPHIIVCVIDALTGKVWANNGQGPYGSLFTGSNSNSTPPGDDGFEFYTTTPTQQENIRRFLQDTIPCGSKVIIYTCGDHNLGDLLGSGVNSNPGLIKAFQSVGGAQFPNIQNNLPYILVGRKCGNAVEQIAATTKDTVFVLDSIPIKRDSGIIFSETVGPAQKWKSMHWHYVSPEQGTPEAAWDTMTVNILGMRANNGRVDTLYKNITSSTFDIYNLDSTINADTFPSLQLVGYAKDRLLKTVPQLKKWQVYYDGVPEVALNPVKHDYFYNPQVQQGDSIKMSLAVENIGDYDMDSLNVDFWVNASDHSKIQLPSFKLKKLKVDSFLIADTKSPTVNLPSGGNIPGGPSSIWVEANPFDSHHKLEEYHFNNIGTVPFTVGVDKINPLMDVTFDGVHIMNGDLVSAKPVIAIRLKDENTFLALNDKSAFDVRIKRPGKSTYDTVSFGSQMTFEPAIMPNNSCRINYMPQLPDGVYSLKVQAKDRSKNISGLVEYNISFEVVNKPTVSSVLNYPNPFSTSTRFVFTLTGTEVPDYFKIQIMTITGKMVKEINKYELGPIHIGRNITEYAWDGKDEFGDQLANGLYLYRVQTQLGGKSLEHRETTSDSFFTQGYGKMYLIR